MLFTRQKFQRLLSPAIAQQVIDGKVEISVALRVRHGSNPISATRRVHVWSFAT